MRFTGFSCSKCMNCFNGGVCSESGSCVCKNGFTGPSCLQGAYNVNCLNDNTKISGNWWAVLLVN